MELGEQNRIGHIPVSKYANRVEIRTLLEHLNGESNFPSDVVTIGGWVVSEKKTNNDDQSEKKIEKGNRSDKSSLLRCCKRKSKLRSPSGGQDSRSNEKSDDRIVKINDGSSVSSLEVRDRKSSPELLPGTCLLIDISLPDSTGSEIKSRSCPEVKPEVKKTQYRHIAEKNYPLANEQQPLHMSRGCLHHRPRTKMVALITRVHSCLVFATHLFFQDQCFQYVQVPIITTTDAEGCSEKFNITSLLSEYRKHNTESLESKSGRSTETSFAAGKEKTNPNQLKESQKDNGLCLDGNISKHVSQSEVKQRPEAGTLAKFRTAHASEEFFARETFLTVSGRLHLASYACTLGKVYSLGPRFIADPTDMHVAEMWDVETEIAFSELDDIMNCAEDFLEFLCRYIHDHCAEDMKFVNDHIDSSRKHLKKIKPRSISRRSYKEVMMFLQMVPERNFKTAPEWGVSLTTEHLSFLAEKIEKGPLIIYDYPKMVKPFYVRLNDDGETVAAFDLVLPKLGILISGSQNEERLDKLNTSIKEFGLPRKQYEWYLDLHRHGTAKHSGFSLRLDLLNQYITCVQDVRDAIPFPRSMGQVDC